MRKFINYIFLLPLAVVLVVLSVANRQQIVLRLDPFSFENPALSMELPLFVFLFMAFLLGMVIGALSIWLSQGKHRKALRKNIRHTKTLQHEYNKNTEAQEHERTEIAPGLPLVTRS